MDYVRCNNCGRDETVLLTKTKNVGTSGSKTLDIVVCTYCGLSYLNPQPTEEMYTQFYSTYGRKSRSVEALIREKADQRLYPEMFSSFLAKTSKILDMGCGKGIFLHFLKEAGYQNLAGLELSRDEISFAKKTFDLVIDYGTIEEYGKKDFDLVTLIALIEHFKNPKQSLEAVRKVLKDDGLLFISTPNVKEMILRKGVSNYFKFVHTYYFSMTTLKSVVEQAGFEVIAERITPAQRTRSALFPRSYIDSDLLLLARKTKPRVEPLKDDYRELQSILSSARKRDRVSSVVYLLDQIRGFGFLFKTLRRVVQ